MWSGNAPDASAFIGTAYERKRNIAAALVMVTFSITVKTLLNRQLTPRTPEALRELPRTPDLVGTG
jgi:hypothetical protein